MYVYVHINVCKYIYIYISPLFAFSDGPHDYLCQLNLICLQFPLLFMLFQHRACAELFWIYGTPSCTIVALC